MPVADLCRTYGMHSETFYAWKRRYAGIWVESVRLCLHPGSGGLSLKPGDSIFT
jgi:hypothetical protein